MGGSFCWGFFFFLCLGPNLNSLDLVLNGAAVVNHGRRVKVQRGVGLVKHLMTFGRAWE